MIAQIFAIIAPVFISAGIGFAWARADWPFPTETVSRLLIFVGTPCLVFHALATVKPDVAALGVIALGAVLALTIFGCLGVVLFKAAGLGLRGHLPLIIFPNAGNMGMPLALFAFGEPGLALAVAYYVITSLTQFTLGQSLASGHFSPARLVRNPVILAVVLALVFMLGGWTLPAWLANTTRSLGDFTIPLLLITLGHSMARLRVKALGRCLALALLRLGVGFAVGLGLATWLGLEGAARGVMIMQSAMPVAVFTYLFAELHDSEPEVVAGTVVLSTALAFAFLPFLLWFVL